MGRRSVPYQPWNLETRTQSRSSIRSRRGARSRSSAAPHLALGVRIGRTVRRSSRDHQHGCVSQFPSCSAGKRSPHPVRPAGHSGKAVRSRRSLRSPRAAPVRSELSRGGRSDVSDPRRYLAWDVRTGGTLEAASETIPSLHRDGECPLSLSVCSSPRNQPNKKPPRYRRGGLLRRINSSSANARPAASDP